MCDAINPRCVICGRELTVDTAYDNELCGVCMDESDDSYFDAEETEYQEEEFQRDLMLERQEMEDFAQDDGPYESDWGYDIQEYE